MEIKEVKEYRLDKLIIEKIILTSLNIVTPNCNVDYDKIIFNWQIKDDMDITGLFLTTIKTTLPNEKREIPPPKPQPSPIRIIKEKNDN